MILSYHPCFEADKNLICAGREPDNGDLEAIKAADAVILPQGCYRSLYEMAHNNCKHVFPDFHTRFKYPGKTGQARLFKKMNAPHPKTKIYPDLETFWKNRENLSEHTDFTYPFVFKFSWGGEGEHVYLIKDYEQLNAALRLAENFEKKGWTGFIVQEYIPSANRTLRVVIIGQKFISYWRVQQNCQSFCSNLAKGGILDYDSDQNLQDAGIKIVSDLCNKTGINLAGFDILFSSRFKKQTPLLLEINYYFGRRGLGGSEQYYKILNKEIIKWLKKV